MYGKHHYQTIIFHDIKMSLPISPFPLTNLIPTPDGENQGKKEKKIFVDDLVSTFVPPSMPATAEKAEKNINILTESSVPSFENVQEAIDSRINLIKKLKSQVAEKTRII